MIWYKKVSAEDVNRICDNTMVPYLGIKITEVGDDYLAGTMPVDHRTKQPLGIVHGGANCVLAETLGSLASNLVLNDQEAHAVGLDIQTNHLQAARSGEIYGKAVPIRLGKTVHVWKIETYSGKTLTSESRLTTYVRYKRV